MQTAVRFAPQVPVLISAPASHETINNDDLDELVQGDDWYNENWGLQFIDYYPEEHRLWFELEGWRVTVSDYLPGIGGYVTADKHTWENTIEHQFVRDEFADPTEFAWSILGMLTEHTVRRDSSLFSPRRSWN